MKSVINLIKENKKYFPEFDYYIALLQKAENNQDVQPDICIEVCKSLIEGASKVILIERGSDTKEELEKKNVNALVKEATKLLKQDDNVIEDDFIRRCASLAQALGALRNARGDISHGRSVPKEPKSTDKLSKLVLNMTESILYYMLDAFFIIHRDKLPVHYEDNVDFNNYLNMTNSPMDETPYARLLSKKMPYSRLLYEQDNPSYIEKLAEFEDYMLADTSDLGPLSKDDY